MASIFVGSVDNGSKPGGDMKKDTLRKLALVLGPICLVMAVVILVYADGMRRWYSGLFFVVMGTVALLSARRWR